MGQGQNASVDVAIHQSEGPLRATQPEAAADADMEPRASNEAETSQTPVVAPSVVVREDAAEDNEGNNSGKPQIECAVEACNGRYRFHEGIAQTSTEMEKLLGVDAV